MEAAKRVARNTGILYARMGITVFISLYSTRLILAALGVEDFGLYNVVGGIILMLGFLNSSMAGASQRFISVAQGEGDLNKIIRIFNMSSLLHWGIAVLIFLLLEIASYFFFHGILNIAPDRLGVAKLLYQFMVFSTLFTVISVPYEAVITSHENMLAYSVIGVIEAVLKLSIALYITNIGMDHLLIYGVLMAVLSIFLLLIKRIYCHRVYAECQLHIRQYYDKPLLKEIGGFAGWSLLSTSTSIINFYGQTLLINIFFGTIINAGQTIAGTVAGQLNVIAATFLKALEPLITKSIGNSSMERMHYMVMISSKLSFFMLMILYVPFFIELPFILKFWLGSVPVYATTFCRLLLIRFLIEHLFTVLKTAISAHGKIGPYQINIAILNIFPLAISTILFKLGLAPYYMYVVFVFYAIASLMITLNSVKDLLDFDISIYFKDVVIRCFFSLLLVSLVLLLPYLMLKESFVRLSIVFILNIISFCFIVYYFGTIKKEKIIFKNLIFFLSKKLCNASYKI